MTTLKNINNEIANKVFSMTNFNYDIREIENNDGTIDLIFDSKEDACKFESLM